MATRRAFLTHSCKLGAATATLSSLGLSLALARRTAAAETRDYRALVCILLAGGNDSFNMLVPNDADQFAEYANLRSDLALEQSTLLPIASIADGPNAGRNYALHPSIPEVQTLYGDGELALIANVGTLLEAVDAAAVESGSALVPLGLYSHADQIQQWQTAVPNARVAHGWGGRIADLLHSQGRSPANGVAMNISLSGNNVFQSGRRTNAYSIHHEYGAPGIYAYDEDTDYGPFRKQMIDDLLDVQHDNLLRREYSRRLRGAIDNQRVYSEAIATAPELASGFSDTPFSQSLYQIAHIIGARDAFGATRQTFFVQVGGWDHHDEVLDNQARMLPWISTGLQEFRDALVELGAFDRVTTFTTSDFARTLTSNGKGSDHGWGGHHLVMGGAVQGGRMFGDYPLLAQQSPLDVGRGVYVPTTSVEEYFAELALWFGVAPGELDLVLPNVRNFYSPESDAAPMGFMV